MASSWSGLHDARSLGVDASADPDDREVVADLVRRAQDGDADAFGSLYDRYAEGIYRFCYHRTTSVALAEDLTSETFFRALRAISTFRWQGRDFGAWLTTIARNLVTDHYSPAGPGSRPFPPGCPIAATSPPARRT